MSICHLLGGEPVQQINSILPSTSLSTCGARAVPPTLEKHPFLQCLCLQEFHHFCKSEPSSCLRSLTFVSPSTQLQFKQTEITTIQPERSEGAMAPTSSSPVTNQRHPFTFFGPIAGLGLRMPANRRSGFGLTLPYVRTSCKPSTFQVC